MGDHSLFLCESVLCQVTLQCRTDSAQMWRQRRYSGLQKGTPAHEPMEVTSALIHHDIETYRGRVVELDAFFI
jgi:hypothetical protein